MNDLELEIIEIFCLLDDEAKERVRFKLDHEYYRARRIKFDWRAWFRDIDALHKKMADENGGVFPSIDTVKMLREIRDGEDDE